MREVLNESGRGIEIVSDIIEAIMSPEVGLTATSTILQAHPELNVVLTTAALAPGVYAALEAAEFSLRRQEQWI